METKTEFILTGDQSPGKEVRDTITTAQQTSVVFTRSLSSPSNLVVPKPRELLARRCRLKQNCPLENYIFTRIGKRDFYSFKEILQVICDQLKSEGTLAKQRCLDSPMSDQIVCPLDLSKALRRSTVTKTEIIDLTAPQLEFLPNLPKDLDKWETNRIDHSEWRFVPESRLRPYLESKTRVSKETYSCHEILTLLKDIIKHENQFDQHNPSIILCNPQLEAALNMKALHVSEIRELVLGQVILVRENTAPNNQTHIRYIPYNQLVKAQEQKPGDHLMSRILDRTDSFSTKSTSEIRTQNLINVQLNAKSENIATTIKSEVSDRNFAVKPETSVANLTVKSEVPETNSVKPNVVATNFTCKPEVKLENARVKIENEAASSDKPCSVQDSLTKPGSSSNSCDKNRTDLSVSRTGPSVSRTGPSVSRTGSSVSRTGYHDSDSQCSSSSSTDLSHSQQSDIISKLSLESTKQVGKPVNLEGGQAPVKMEPGTSSRAGPGLPVLSKVEADKTTPPPDSSIYSNPNSRFRLKEKLRETFSGLRDFDASRIEFTLKEIFGMLMTYLLSKKLELFDPRNVKVAIVKDDPLGKAFGVSAFHRMQTKELLVKQLIYVEPSEPSEQQNSQQSPSCESMKSSPGVSSSLPPFPALMKAASMPARSSCNADSLADLLASTRKRNASGELAADALSKRNRSDSMANLATPVEPTYSTATSTATATTTTTESQSTGDEEDESGLDTEFEVEYEVDSTEEINLRPPQALGGGSGPGSSSEDSEFEVNVVTQQVEVNDEEKDNWADSEAEINNKVGEVKRGVEEGETKVKMIKLDMLQCYRCKELRQPRAKYCGRCWQERSSWLPDRPKKLKSKRRRDNDREQMSARSKGSQSDVTTPDTDIGEVEKDSCPETQDSSQELTISSQELIPSSQEMIASSQEPVASSQELIASTGQDSNQEPTESPQESIESTQETAESTQDQLEVTQEVLHKTSLEDIEDKVLNKPVNMEPKVLNKSISMMQQTEKKEIKLMRSFSTNTEPENAGTSSSSSKLCHYCYVRPKDTSLIHGRIGHQVSCYRCAKKHWKQSGRCPVCQRRIEKFVKIIEA